MLRKCCLETDGYRVLFVLTSVGRPKTSVDVVVEFTLDPRLGSFSVKSLPAFDTLQDLQSLVTYFEEHIARLEQDSNSESPTFLTYGFGFQVQALSGEVRSPTDGEFGLRFMVNLGMSHEEATRTYFGGEAEVTLEQVKSFTSSLQAALAELGCGELEPQSR